MTLSNKYFLIFNTPTVIGMLFATETFYGCHRHRLRHGELAFTPHGVQGVTGPMGPPGASVGTIGSTGPTGHSGSHTGATGATGFSGFESYGNFAAVLTPYPNRPQYIFVDVYSTGLPCISGHEIWCTFQFFTTLGNTFTTSPELGVGNTFCLSGYFSRRASGIPCPSRNTLSVIPTCTDTTAGVTLGYVGFTGASGSYTITCP